MTAAWSPSTIKTLPAVKRNYKNKNMFGGRRIPAHTIGAAYRPLKSAASGPSVQFVTSVGQLHLIPNRYGRYDA